MHTPDMLIHIHPELSAEGRAKLENEVMDCNGVIAAHFDHHTHPHDLVVVYNPDAISGKQILDTVQKFDPAASMIGL